MATTTKKAIVLATSLASLTAVGTAHAEDQGLTKSIISKAERIKRKKSINVLKTKPIKNELQTLNVNKKKNRFVSNKKKPPKKNQKKKHQKPKKQPLKHLLKTQHLSPMRIHVSAQMVFSSWTMVVTPNKSTTSFMLSQVV